MTSAAFFLPIPLAFEDSAAVLDLCDRVRDPDAGIYAVRLWQWRKQHGASITGPNAAAVVERIARWRRKRGALAQALEAAGLVVGGPDGIVIVDPDEIVRVEWLGARDEPAAQEPEPVEDAIARRRRLDRERKAKRKAMRNDAERARNEAERARNEAERARNDSASTAERSGTTAEVSASAAEHSASHPSSTRATQTQTQIQTQTQTQKSEVQRVASADAPPPDDGREPRSPDTASRTAVAAVPSEATPAQPCRPVGPVLTLEPEAPTAKARKRAPTLRPKPDPAAHAAAVAEREAERADGERWRERAEVVLGYPRDEPWGRAWHRFREARREHGIDAMLRSLDGLRGDEFARTCGLAALLSSAVISKGLARTRAGPVGVNAALAGWVDDGPNTLVLTDADRAWDGRL